MKNKLRKALLLLASLGCFCLCAPAVHAQGDILSAIVSVDENGDMIYGTYAVVGVWENQAYIFTDPAIREEGGGFVLMTTDETLYEDITYSGEDSQFGYGLLTCDVQDDPCFLTMSGAHQGQTAYLHYINAEPEEAVAEVTILDYGEQETCYTLTVQMVDGADVAGKDGRYITGALLSEDGELLGVYTSAGGFITHVISNSFYAEEEPSPTQAPEQTSPPATSDSGGKGRTETNDAGNMLMYVVCGFLALVAIALVALVLFLKKRKHAASLPDPQPSPQAEAIPQEPELEEIPPTEGVEEIPFTKPIPKAGDEPRRVSLMLCAEGGIMDGRRYPVSEQPITIGRDPVNFVCYPAETPGISRKHCQLFWNNGVLMLMDLGSSSGTFLRGTGRLSPQVPVALRSGDTFYLGEKRNAFVVREV